MNIYIKTILIIIISLTSSFILAQNKVNSQIESAKKFYSESKFNLSIEELNKAEITLGEPNAEIILWKAKAYFKLSNIDKVESLMSSFYLYPVSNEQEKEMQTLVNDVVGYKPAPPKSSNGEDLNKQGFVNPKFKGGSDALSAFVIDNIIYPEKALSQKIEGTVYISFNVDKNGSISDAIVVKGIGGGCDEEALRLVNSFPLFEPATLDGQPVKTELIIPITFKL